MKRVLIGLLGLVCVAGLVIILTRLFASQERMYSIADVQNQRAALIGRTVLVEARMWGGETVGPWPPGSMGQSVDFLHPPRGASAVLFLIPPRMDDRRATAASGLWAAPQAAPPPPRHPSLMNALHGLPVVGRLFPASAAGLAGLRYWRLALLPQHGPICGLFVINSSTPTPSPIRYCDEALIVDAY